MSTNYSDHILIDWAFAAQDGIIDVVQKDFPSELYRWPIAKAFEAKGYVWNNDYIIVVLVDKFAQFPKIGSVETFPYDAYLDKPSLEIIKEWQDFLWSKLSLRSQDFVMIIPYTEGKNIEERWNKLKEEEKDLWRNQVKFGVMRHASYLRDISTNTSFPINKMHNESPKRNSDPLRDQLEKDLVDDESQNVEWKREFPPNAKELADNMASFATSNNGRIYIGIDRKGNLSPTDPLTDATKDDVRMRVTGNAKSVWPSVSHLTSIIEKNGRNIIRIDVPKGPEPIYYSKNVPYIRDNSQSRPATSDEVKELMQKYFRQREEIEERRMPVLRFDGIRKDNLDNYYLKVEKTGEGVAMKCFGSIDIDDEEILHNFPLYWRNISVPNVREIDIGSKEYLRVFQIIDYNGRKDLVFNDFGEEGKYIPQRRPLEELSSKNAEISISSNNARVPPRHFSLQIDALIKDAISF